MKGRPPRSAGRPPGAVSFEKSIFTVFGIRSSPDGSAQAVGFIWSLFRAKPSILNPFRTIFDDLGDVETGQVSSVETGQMSSVKTRQMSSVETGQMSSVETRQMSQQQSSVLSQQWTSVLSQQKTSILSQQKTRQLPGSGRLLLCLL